jgi:molybdate transport system permease protein
MNQAVFDWQPIFLSLKVASAALVLAFFIGTLAAHFLVSRRFFGQGVLEAIVLLPLVLPPVVTGYALLVLLGKNGVLGAPLQRAFHVQLLFTPTAAVLASTVVALPLSFTTAKAAFHNLDLHWLEAARCSGASGARVFWTIAIPLAWPGLVAGGVLAFARGLGEFGATIMVAGNIAGETTTAPVAIYMAVEGGEWNVARNYVLLLAALNFLFLLFLNFWTARFAAPRRR